MFFGVRPRIKKKKNNKMESGSVHSISISISNPLSEDESVDVSEKEEDEDDLKDLKNLEKEMEEEIAKDKEQPEIMAGQFVRILSLNQS